MALRTSGFYVGRSLDAVLVQLFIPPKGSTCQSMVGKKHAQNTKEKILCGDYTIDGNAVTVKAILGRTLVQAITKNRLRTFRD